MKKMLLAVVGMLVFAALHAQTVMEDIHRNIWCSASNYMAYPEPVQTTLTPAPRGMKPFYISHYGRHGSRYHSRPSIYNAPYLILAKADSLGKLTDLGRDVMMRLDRIRHDAENRWGELTPLGEEQQRQIARRMMERFPQVFKGKTDIDARSTTVGRCILSMEHALMQMLIINPHLNIHHYATHRDMGYLNQQDRQLMALKNNKASMSLYRQYLHRIVHSDRLMASLFNDTAYVHRHIDALDFNLQLFFVAAILQNTPIGEQVSLYDVYTEEEAYNNWMAGNIRWYIGWGPSDVNGVVQPFTQRNLLRKFIHDADSCIRQPKNNVQLRFGHETVLLPFLCLLDVNGLGRTTSDLEHLEDFGWVNYRIIPMAANIQFVFYRKNAKDRQVLFKVLLNEQEATLPLPTTTPPYYRWSDFRDYYLRKLDAYEAQAKHE